MPSTPPPRKPGATTAATFALVVLVVAIALGGLWWAEHDEPSTSGTNGDAPSDIAASASVTDPGLGDAAEEIAAQDFPDDPRVVVISVDGLGSRWVSRSTTPTLSDLLTHGAGTLNARTEVEKTVTLPNHTSMVTGVRVNAGKGGHGVTWNRTSTRSVAPGTESVFSTIDEAGGSSAVFVGKEKFEMWSRAWPGRIDELMIEEDQPTLVHEAITELSKDESDLVFLHLAGPDSAGHDEGWGSNAYLDAVAAADADIDRVVSAVVDDPELSEDVVVIVTADHGGVPGTTAHADRTRAENYTIPFLVWGPGITPGDLYALNPEYVDPGRSRPGYDGPQPVRNGDVANLVTDLLDLDPVPGSQFDVEHDLDIDVD